MHRHYSAVAALLVLGASCQREVEPAPAAARRADAVFVNGDFETGSLTGWAVTTKMNYGITYPPTSRVSLNLQDGGIHYTQIVSGAAESLVPSGLTSAASLRVPKYGTKATVVNQLGKNNNVNALSQTFTVTSADVDPADNKIHVRFALAPVLNSGGHGAADQPYFWVTLNNVTKGTTMFGTFNFANQTGVPWKIEGTNYYTDWQSFDIAPGNVALSSGDTIQLEVIGAGCSLGGHWGEVYVDGFGAFLPGLQVAASAPQSANAGSNIMYTLSYQNRGTGAADNTTVTFNLPASVSYQALSAPGASCTAPSVGATTGAVVCNVGTVNPSASGSFTVTVQIAAAATGKISAGNYAIAATGVSSLLGPLVETNITSGVQYADLSAVITDGVAAVGWGQPYDFTITVSNAGPTAVTGATVAWAMPAQLASASWTCAGTGTCGAASGSGSIASTANLPAGTSVTYSVSSTLVSGSSSSSMSNLVTVDPPGSISDNNTNNNQAIDIDAIGTLRTLTFAKSGGGTGRLVTSPAAVDCTAGCSSASTSFIDGTSVSVTATATTGHTFGGWSGPCTGTANPCTFTVAGDATLTATFTPPSFTLTASAGANGSISPSGSVSVAQGQDQTFTLTPSTGYHVASLTVDGASAGAPSSYTFTNVTAAHTIAVTFAIDTFAVAGVGDAHGSVTCTSPVSYGASSTCTIAPAAGYELVSLTDGATSVTPSGNSYVATNVVGPRTITGVFQKSRGTACASSAECGSGQCVDGVCCNTACNGQCEACAQAGSVGTCAAVSGAPVGGRSACGSDGSSCGGTCNGALRASCSYPTSACRSASCSGGVETHAASCDGAGACPAAVTASCAPFICGANACAPACADDSGCAAGFYCAAGACLPKHVSGTTCGRDSECSTGQCVDGVCCNAACNGQCEACDVAGSVGTCVAVSGAPHGARVVCDSDGTSCGGACDGASRTACAYPGAASSCRAASCAAGTATLAAACDGQGHCPAAQTEACAPYVCGAAACSGNCGVDADCTAGNWCSGGVCEPKKTPGVACGADHQCGSGFCTDGVCCDVACDGQCEACDVAGSVGSCSAVTGSPHAGRAQCASDGSSCGGACSGQRRDACTYPTASVQCRAASCAAGVATLAAACDGAGACPAEQTQACTPFVCGASACLGNCHADADCSAGNWCAAGVCVPKRAPGVACGGANQCGSGFCVDGVCCDVACDGQCQACDVPGSAGSCVPVAGAPHGGRPACATDGTACGGQCGGEDPTACAYPATECRAASCAGGVATMAATCSEGRCPPAQERSCGRFACGSSACMGDCASDAQCADGSWCAAGVCEPKRPAGGACSGSNQCGSGFCVDGVCCNGACDGQCEACDVAGSVGTCAAVAGAPHGARSACASDSTVCGGTCDGARRDACAYPAVTVSCVEASCEGGVETHASACDGQGACVAPTLALCGNFACGETTCRTGCVADSDCGASGYCAAGVCQARGDRTLWKVQGGVGLGCQSSGGELVSLALALAVVGLFKRRRLAKVAALGVAVVSGAASAQTSGVSRTFLLERFQPQPGSADVLGVQSPGISPHLMPRVLVHASYADVPLRATTVTDDGVRRTLAASQTTMTLSSSLGLFNRFELGLAVPVVLTQSVGAEIVDPALGAAGSQVALGDLRVQAKARVYDVGPFSFGVSVPVTLPTAGNAAYAGYSGPTVTPTALAQWRGARRSAVLLDLGVAVRQPQQLLNLTVGSAFTYAVAGKVDLVPSIDLSAQASVAGEVGFLGASAVQSPLEALVALRWMPFKGLVLTLGAGPGLSPGYGTPRFRVIAALGWVPGDDDAPASPPASLPAVSAPAPAPAPAPVAEVVKAEAPPAPPVPEPAVEPEPEPVAARARRVLPPLEKVFFETGRAEVARRSLHVLDEIARLLCEAPELALVRIEAHTDDSAPAAYNAKLSADRAAWVRSYLIAHGVEASRLAAQGYGLSRPLTSNATAEGRATNRRVEFVVVEPR